MILLTVNRWHPPHNLTFQDSVLSLIKQLLLQERKWACFFAQFVFYQPRQNEKKKNNLCSFPVNNNVQHMTFSETTLLGKSSLRGCRMWDTCMFLCNHSWRTPRLLTSERDILSHQIFVEYRRTRRPRKIRMGSVK